MHIAPLSSYKFCNSLNVQKKKIDGSFISYSLFSFQHNIPFSEYHYVFFLVDIVSISRYLSIMDALLKRLFL